ncbi:unnamed protein product, partial [Mesorhabditis belari]|uniref:Sphingomyelin synthase-like domain-containing protein n=1 Tax=Mesorhabditis belari TaxID=2138241 RepID=A0AAF3EWP5_9BILA
MGGHRRDQSDSTMPLRSNADFIGPESQELQVRASSSENSLSANGGIAITIDPTDPDHRSHLHHKEHMNEPRQSEALKTVIAFFCLTISAFLNFFLLTVIHDIVPREPLPDIVFLTIPQQRWAWSVGDVLSTLSSIVAFTVVLCIVIDGAVILGVTFLPPSFHNRDQICQLQVNRTAMYGVEIATRFLTYVVTLGLTSGQDKILCGDLMFSGHTVVLTIMYFVQLQYTPRGLVILRYIAAPITFPRHRRFGRFGWPLHDGRFNSLLVNITRLLGISSNVRNAESAKAARTDESTMVVLAVLLVRERWPEGARRFMEKLNHRLQ